MTLTQLKRFQTTLAENGIEAALISSTPNQYYLSGFFFHDGYVLVTPAKAFLLCDSRYIEAARAKVTEMTVIRPEGSMMAEISALCAEEGISSLIIEEDALTYAAFARLKALLDKVSITPNASKLLLEQRAVKLPYELEIINKAQIVTDAAFEHILGFINPDRTEAEVAYELEHFMRSNGADAIAFSTIAVSGKSSSLPHGVPSKNKLSRGFLTMDFGAKIDGYCADMTRTVCIGDPDDEMKKVYNTVLAAQTAALEGLSAGIGCKAADAIARDIISNAGYGKSFGHSLGHGVGLFVHESPRLAPSVADGVKLVEGNVVTVEPGIYLEGRFGCRIEDMVAIEKDGIRNFTKSPKELIVL